MQFDNQLCKVCKTLNLKKFISFGKMPVANAFLKKEDLYAPEYKYDMEVGFCENCKMVQLLETPPYEKYIVPDETGKTHYAFFSSTSKFMEEHFYEFAKEVESRFLFPESKILEIGSNDGIMLKAFKDRSRTLGVEPSHNVADVAIDLGIETIKKFFNEELADNILFNKGKFKAILSTNVFLNIIDIHTAMKGITKLLEDDGVFITEDPYIVDILEKNSYDQIYDEHIWYFSLHSLSNLYEMHGMEIFDAEMQWVHGGSMRVYACKKGAYQKTERFLKYLEEEKQKGIGSIDAYLEFAQDVEENKRRLKQILYDIKSQGKKIVGYAAASKGTIVQNYCDIGPETLEYISDSTPFKQGLFSPGKHIPIVSPEHFHDDKNADFALLFAWNHAKEITQKEKEFIDRGGRFVVHLPYPHVVQPGEFDKMDTIKKVPIISDDACSTADKKEMDNEVAPDNKIDSQSSDSNINVRQLKIIANDQGYLFEALRADDKIYDGKFGQVLISELYPGVIKGLHLHHNQTDYTTCIKGNIKYVTVKEIQGKEPEIKVIAIGEKNPILVKTPPEVWHGYMPLANERATVLHIMDKPFNINDPDTERKDVYAFGDVWTVKPS